MAAVVYVTSEPTIHADSGPIQWPAIKKGLLINYGLGTFMNPEMSGTSAGQVPAAAFAPTALDARQWAHVAKQAGYSMAVLTVKGGDGFCLWPTKASDYSVANSPVTTDIVGEFVAACKAEGIASGFQYAVSDAHLEDGPMSLSSDVGPHYFNAIKNQLAELAAHYPEVRVILLPGMVRLTASQFDELYNTVKALNPQCLVPGVKEPDGRHFVATWNSAAVNKGWTWKANGQLESAEDLYQQYSTKPKWKPVFLVSVGPDRAGHIPDEYVARLMEFNKLAETFSASTDSSGTPTATKAPTAERLKQVKSLYDQGLINKDDYDRKVKEIMDSL